MEDSRTVATKPIKETAWEGKSNTSFKKRGNGITRNRIG